MHKVRVIPVLLLKHDGLEKSVRFRDPVYVGSPINAARVFNGRNVDELILLDIAATAEHRGPALDLVSQITEEAFMPVTVGGGVRSVEAIADLLHAGADRVVLNTAAVDRPGLITAAAERFGRQCIVVSIDAKRHPDGGYEVFAQGGRAVTGLDPLTHARRVEALGAGEILLTSVDRDGTMDGYDLELTRLVSDAVDIPVIACGGAGSVADLAAAADAGHASAVAAGAFFLFFGPRRTVLITYPTDEELAAHFGSDRIRSKTANPTVLPAGVVRC